MINAVISISSFLCALSTANTVNSIYAYGVLEKAIFRWNKEFIRSHMQLSNITIMLIN